MATLLALFSPFSHRHEEFEGRNLSDRFLLRRPPLRLRHSLVRLENRRDKPRRKRRLTGSGLGFRLFGSFFHVRLDVFLFTFRFRRGNERQFAARSDGFRLRTFVHRI